MKKTLISILGAVAVFAGCTKENENYGFIVPEGKELVKITATAENSRTTVDIDDNCANYAWNFSDTLAVVEEDAECPSKFTLVGEKRACPLSPAMGVASLPSLEKNLGSEQEAFL